MKNFTYAYAYYLHLTCYFNEYFNSNGYLYVFV